MASFNEMKRIKDRVQHLLTSRPDSRNSDDLLISLFWYHEKREEIQNGLSAQDFLKLYAKGSITSPESIRRIRQKLQEKYLELRGNNYKERRKEGKVVTENIKDL